MESSIKKSVIYARVSSVGDRQNTARQVEDLTAYAERNGMELVKTYEEHISGAKKNAERPVLCECLDFCVSNKIDTLLLSELSRLGRNVWEVQENIKFCIDNGLNVYFQKEDIRIFLEDGRVNPFANIMVSVLGTAAELERESIKFRLNSGRAKYIADGGKLGRKKGTAEDSASLLAKYPEAVSLLKKGKSIRDTASRANISPTTAQKIKKLLAL